jgi:hypothetical protein
MEENPFLKDLVFESTSRKRLWNAHKGVCVET